MDRRAGVIFQSGALRSTIQYSYVGKGFSDASNTVSNPTGSTGAVPAYHVWDWSADRAFLTHYHVSAGSTTWPTPGISPAVSI